MCEDRVLGIARGSGDFDWTPAEYCLKDVLEFLRNGWEVVAVTKPYIALRSQDQKISVRLFTD